MTRDQRSPHSSPIIRRCSKGGPHLAMGGATRSSDTPHIESATTAAAPASASVVLPLSPVELSAGADPYQVVRSHPASCLAWATVAEDAWSDRRVIDAYAYARVGYHRGLDQLRKSGWRGSGYVRWSQPQNLGFLRCLEGLRAMAAKIGETDEAERCALFLQQLDPTRQK